MGCPLVLGIHLSFAMPGKDSTALDNELALDENLTPFPLSLCQSEPFHHGNGKNSVCGGHRVTFLGFLGSSFPSLK
jgi:hypothetical protein